MAGYLTVTSNCVFVELCFFSWRSCCLFSFCKAANRGGSRNMSMGLSVFSSFRSIFPSMSASVSSVFFRLRSFSSLSFITNLKAGAAVMVAMTSDSFGAVVALSSGNRSIICLAVGSCANGLVPPIYCTRFANFSRLSSSSIR